MKWFYPVVLWAGSFALMIWFSLTQYQLASDSLFYYVNYEQSIEKGWWSLADNLPKASLAMTLLPATIQKILHSDFLMTFKLYSLAFLPFLPVVVYFIALKFVKPLIACSATIIILGTQFIFLRLPAYSQMGIATLFFALLVLVILSNIRWKYIWVTLLSCAIVVSHYSIAYMTIGIISLSFGMLWLMREKRSAFIWAFHSLFITALVWTGFVVTNPSGVLQRTFRSSSTEARAYAVEESYSKNPSVVNPQNFVNEKTLAEVDMSTVRKRDAVIEQAFGKGLRESSLLGKIKWLIGWIGLLLIVKGSIMTWKLNREIAILSLACLSIMAIWVIVPYISIAYGIGRIYFQASVILVVGLGLFMENIWNKVRAI